MKLAIMQPYLFPYLGYFSLIKNTDRFILFDPVQFIYHGWIERNRVLKQNSGWLYVKVPLLKHSRETLIKDIRIDNSQDWKQTILSQLQHYRNMARNYYRVVKLLEDLFAEEYDDIVQLNRAAIVSVCEYLKIRREISVFSQMNLSIETPQAADEWALNICRSLGKVTEYWNPPGGKSFFDRSKYERAGIGLKFQKIILTPYDQKRSIFEPGLSILDVMMFNSPEEIVGMLDHFELI